MEVALAALIDAIFFVMGKPDTAIRQCPLALDKWIEMVAGPIQTMLGLNLDTNKLMVAIPGSYVSDIHNLISTTRHENCQTFTIREAQQLTGKLGHLVEEVPWVFHLLTQLYASITHSLAEKKRL